MNSVPEQISKELNESTTADVDRRRGMKLISCNSSKTQSRFRIAFADDLLDRQEVSPMRTTGTDSKSGEVCESVPRQTTAPVVMLAAVAGLAIGFFVGRRYAA